MAQRCRLLQRQAKAGIGILVQLRLVQHHTSIDGISSYQANLTNAYNLLRTGRMAALADERHGSTAAVIIEALAAHGFATVRQLETAVTESSHKPNGSHNGTNGFSSANKFQAALKSLVEDGFISRVRPAHLQIPHDARQAVEGAHLPTKSGGKKGETERLQRVERIVAEMEQQMNSFVSDDALRHAFRTLDDDQQQGAVEEELLLCLNYSFVVGVIRNAAVEQDVSRTLGKTSKQLAKAVLRQIPLQVAPLEPDPNSRQELQALAIARLHDDVRDSIRREKTAQMNGTHDTVMTNGVNHDIDYEDIEDGLRIISEGPYAFLLQSENTGQWSVDKYELADWTRQREVLRLMSSRIDSMGLRLIRMMIDKGKLDEKLLQEHGLLAAKEMRQTLQELHNKGFIELQEVPREPHRQPNRTIYLWFHDPLRTRDVLLGELYKTMTRLYQRLQIVERKRMEATLEKIERDDVRDRVEEVVVGQEMVELQQFQAKQKWLLAEIHRLDESVALLRDL